MRFQLALFPFALALVSVAYVFAQDVKICEPKSVFMDDCNRCRCSDDGFDKSCTRIMCVKKPGSELGDTRRADEGGFSCVPGEKFNISCRQCICTESRNKPSAVCTLEICPEELASRPEREEGDSKYCIPGTFFYDDCSECICPPSGIREGAACTLTSCF